MSAYGEVSKGIFVTNRPIWEMMKLVISSNEEAYKFTDVSYFSRFNSDVYDTLENVQPIYKLTIDNILLQVSLFYSWT